MAHRNVRRLQERQSIAVRIDSPAFHHGFHEGMTGERDGRLTQVYAHPITEQDIVSLVRNLCEVMSEGWLTEEHLRHDCGVIAGWLLRQEA